MAKGMWHRIGLRAVWMAASVVVVWVSAACAEEASPWQNLPEQTVAALRVPSGSRLAESMQQTKFGKVMFSEQRKAKLLAALQEADSEDLAELYAQLKEYGLEPEDLWGLLRGETGYGVIMVGEEGEQKVFHGLAWFEPGAELAKKYYEVLDRIVEESDAEPPLERVDLQIADQPVMQLLVPVVEIVYEKEFMLGDDYQNLPEEEQEEAWNQAYEEYESSAVEKIYYRSVLVGTVGARLLVAHSFQPVEQEVAGEVNEQLEEVFASWVDAAADEDRFVARLAGNPTVIRVEGLAGESMFEMLADLRPLLGELEAAADENEMVERAWRVLRLEGLGPMALRTSAEGAVWRSCFGMSVPVPREGLLKLFDQPEIGLEPPQWVPADAVRYFQLSFDLGKAYELIKELATAEFPEQTSGGFAMLEAQVQNFAQASLTEVLSALGHRHTFISFGLENSEDAEEPTADERIAFVWQLEDEEIWSRLLKAMAPFTGMAPGIESAEEQGFSGWRMKQEGFEGGLLVGKGYLVFGYGSGVLETVLASLNNPPSGDDALRGSEVYRQATNLLELPPGLGVEVTDGERYMAQVFRALRTQLLELSRVMEIVDGDDEFTNDEGDHFIQAISTLLPTDKELEGLMGVIVGRYEVSDEGIYSESAQELPTQ